MTREFTHILNDGREVLIEYNCTWEKEQGEYYFEPKHYAAYTENGLELTNLDKDDLQKIELAIIDDIDLIPRDEIETYYVREEQL